MARDSNAVTVKREALTLTTWQPLAPDCNPMFLERRVYQGSCGRVYPLPFVDRIAAEPVELAWDAVVLENEFLRVTLLPQLGGRIYAALDKTNGYDLFYRNEVIKPALVGLAGPWISGGVEFNWPQHHRPSTYLPADVHVEKHADGSVTVWMGEHEPLTRMKGMHGVCLHPGRSVLELKARVFNRTARAQTFLWWANAAARVHERYQSFFPEDVRCVADHAKRAVSAYPLCDGHYYGVDYGARAGRRTAAGGAANDLSWYANIPVPTSYMCAGTRDDFFGGYDHAAEAGVVHVANHHIAPGKKQWTWGNDAFGRAWDRHLTVKGADGKCAPYIELMAGVFTDNQPDFSFLMPGETKTWSQCWYPLRRIGAAQQANERAAASLNISGRVARAGVCVSERLAGARVRLSRRGKVLREWVRDLAPDAPLVESVTVGGRLRREELRLTVSAADGAEIINYEPRRAAKDAPVPVAATEPLLPAEMASNDELYVTGLHLEQYRHATRRAEDYWLEAVRRDAGDARCNLALGRWRLRRGELAAAEKYFRAAIGRLTLRNPNPYDGEAHYHLGLALAQQGRAEEAYAAFYKATWNQAWQGAGFLALAEMDCQRGEWAAAMEHLNGSLRVNLDNLLARDLLALIFQKTGHGAKAEEMLRSTLRLDPLDWLARWLLADAALPVTCDAQARLDVALDLARAGFNAEALEVVGVSRKDAKTQSFFNLENLASLRLGARVCPDGAEPLLHYYAAWLHGKLGDRARARQALAAAAKAAPDYCFPARAEEIGILEFAMRENPRDARAPYYLGNLFYDRQRYAEAIALWERAAKLDNKFSVVWRNLGIAHFNVSGKPAKAAAAYERAFKANPRDARLLFERDQLWKRLGRPAAARLRELRRHPALVESRDDLTIEFCALLNAGGRAGEALAILSTRAFQPWEGGEGMALAQYARASIGLARAALAGGDAAGARRLLEAALTPPESLGETWHPLANGSELWYWLGESCAAGGDAQSARRYWTKAAEFRGDFQEMRARNFSEMTYYSALALNRLNRKAAAEKLLRGLREHARALAQEPARIDYFATSLPTMLLFNEDLQARQTARARGLEELALRGLKEIIYFSP